MLSAPVPSVPASSRTGSASHLGRQFGGPPIWWMLFSISSFTRHVIDQSTLHLQLHLYFCLHYDHLSRQLVFHPHYARPNQRHQACHHPSTVEWTLTANKHIWKKKSTLYSKSLKIFWVHSDEHFSTILVEWCIKVLSWVYSKYF